MNDIVNLLAAGVVTLWIFGASVHSYAGRSPQAQAFNQNLVKAWNSSSTIPKQPVKQQAAKKPNYYR